MWLVGGRYAIQWDSLYRLPNNLYYNNYTRVKIQLRSVQTDNVVALVVDEYPFVYGSVYWAPRAENGINSTTITNGIDAFDKQGNAESKFYIELYPSYFDWPGDSGCSSCKKNGGAVTSQPFGLVTNCTIVHCAHQIDIALTGGAMAIPNAPGSQGADQQTYMSTVKAVGLGVGVTVAAVFVIVGLLYTKRTRRSWNAYRQRRSGVVYKPSSSTSIQSRYKPRAVGESERPGSPDTSRFFAVEDKDLISNFGDQWSEMGVDAMDDDISFSEARTQTPPIQPANSRLFPQHDRLQILELPAQPPNAYQGFLPPRAGNNLRMTSSSDPAKPPVPPRMEITSNSLPTITSSEAAADASLDISDSHDEAAVSDVNSPQVFGRDQPSLIQQPTAIRPSSPASFPSIHRSEAILVGNTFRSVLRVATPIPGDDESDTSYVTGETSFSETDSDRTLRPDIFQNTTDGWTGASPSTAAVLDTLGKRAQIRRTGFQVPDNEEEQEKKEEDNNVIVPTTGTSADDFGISPVLSGMKWMEPHEE